MGAALQVDWNEVRTLALAIGVREAARQMGVSEDATMQRSKREAWMDKHRADQAMIETAKAKVRTTQGMSATPVSAADVLSAMGGETRAKLASVAQRAARRLDEMEPNELMSATVSAVAKDYTTVASKLHGWDKPDPTGQSGVVINIALAGLTPDMARACAGKPVEIVEG